MAKLPLGKIPIETLNSTVLSLTGAASDRLVTPPKAGLDFAAIKLAQGFMVVSSDPVTGVSRDVGHYAVMVSANDVATSGNRPQFAESVVLLPEGSTPKDVKSLAKQVHEAAKEAGIAIVGGHTEVTPGLKRPVVVATVFSFVDSFVTSGDALEGDVIMMTKTAGLEGTAELAKEAGVAPAGLAASVLRRAQGLISQISVTEEAVAAFRTGRVHAMHDCTEGGVLGAVFEMSLASGLGFVLNEAEIPVAPETKEICDRLSIDPIRLIGSGSLLLAVERGAEADVEGALRPICSVTRIGQFRSGRRVMIGKDGRSRSVSKAPEDELWRVLARQAGSRKRL